MTAERVTVSLPPDLVRQAKGRVEAGAAENFSAFVARALQDTMARDRGLAELDRVGRRPPAEALAAARRTLGLGPAPDRGASRATA